MLREFILYVKEEEGSARAYVTPCFSVDKMFWEERGNHNLQIIGKSRSLAFLFALREQVQRYVFQGNSLEGILDKLYTYTEQVNRLYTREFSRLYGANHQEGKEHSPFSLMPVPDVDKLTDNQMTSRCKVLGKQSEKLFSVIAGRSLLWEEMELLLQKEEINWADISLSSMIVEKAQQFGKKQEEIVAQAAFQWLVLQEKALLLPGIIFHIEKGFLRHRLLFTCQRCGSHSAIRMVRCQSCYQGCAYCEECLDMGRSKCCSPYFCVAWKERQRGNYVATAFPTLHTTPLDNAYPSCNMDQVDNGLPCSMMSSGRLLQWQGRLSPLQAEAAEKAKLFVGNVPGIEIDRVEPMKRRETGSDRFLIWAVCGAGKTELIFPAVEQALAAGGQVAIATPRKDVMLELAPRLQRAFPLQSVVAVHGSSKEKWKRGEIAIITTHQLLRCYQRFQLLVVDEVDAFPFHQNKVLYRAVERAICPEGKILYLSATPPKYLIKQLVTHNKGKPERTSNTHVIVPIRYHGNPLPVPVIRMEPGLQKQLKRMKPVTVLLDFVRGSLETSRQVFLFVPRVRDIEEMLFYLQYFLNDYASQMAGVHAADPKREEKVQLFRDRVYRLLVTTTILERGVTIPRSDCVVAGADAPIFDEASLVQIAGRVGRSADAPEGSILYLLSQRVKPPFAAIRQILLMNRLASQVKAGVD